MKEQLEQARQFYMDLWAYHLQSALDLRRERESDEAWKTVVQNGQELIDRYGGDDRLRIFIGRMQDEIAGAVREGRSEHGGTDGRKSSGQSGED